MNRIAISGSPGFGKSILAQHLGPRLGLPVFHLAPLSSPPGWVSQP